MFQIIIGIALLVALLNEILIENWKNTCRVLILIGIYIILSVVLLVIK